MESIIIVLLVITSLVGLTFIVERGLALQWRKVVPAAVREAVESCRTAEDLPMLRRICEQHPCAMSRLLVVAQDHLDWTRDENIETLQTTARHEVSRLENGLVILEIVVGVAPLLGLVGTIFGLITQFAKMGQPGMGDTSSLSSGIALALNATLLGLITAIPSLVGWNYYSRKIDSLGIEMERVCDEFLRRQYRLKAQAEAEAAAAAKAARKQKAA